jgi:hypothetical protein
MKKIEEHTSNTTGLTFDVMKSFDCAFTFWMTHLHFNLDYSLNCPFTFWITHLSTLLTLWISRLRFVLRIWLAILLTFWIGDLRLGFTSNDLDSRFTTYIYIKDFRADSSWWPAFSGWGWKAGALGEVVDGRLTPLWAGIRLYGCWLLGEACMILYIEFVGGRRLRAGVRLHGNWGVCWGAKPSAKVYDSLDVCIWRITPLVINSWRRLERRR